MGMGFAPTWLRQVSPLLHMTTLTIGLGLELPWQTFALSNWVLLLCYVTDGRTGLQTSVFNSQDVTIIKWYTSNPR